MRLDLGAPRIEAGVGQINADRSAHPVREKIEGEATPLSIVKPQTDPIVAARAILGFEGYSAVEADRNAVEAGATLEMDTRSIDVDSKVSVAEVAFHRRPGN